MVPEDAPGNDRKSPSEPRRFLEFLRGTPVWAHLRLQADFDALRRAGLLPAHKVTSR
jgi:hypothetical protein